MVCAGVQDKHVTTGRINQAGVNCGVKCRHSLKNNNNMKKKTYAFKLIARAVLFCVHHTERP